MMFNEISEQSIETYLNSEPIWKRVGRVIGGVALAGGFIAFGVGIVQNFNNNHNNEDLTAITTEEPLYSTRNQEGAEFLTAGVAGMSVGLFTVLVCAKKEYEDTNV